MTARDFVYWLNGHLEIAEAAGTGPLTLNADQVAIIKRHLAMVFIHDIDPAAGSPEHQAKLDEAHRPPKVPHEPIGGYGPGGVAFKC